MLDTISLSQVFVLDQDEALDFYVGKLGLEVNTDQDLGFMRWLTVSVPGEPGRAILLEKPGPPAMDEATAEQVRRAGHEGRDRWVAGLQHDGLPQDLRGASRVEWSSPGTDREQPQDRLRSARPFGNAIRSCSPRANPNTGAGDLGR
jgi:catechol 2,3-dioxygenase-like lactoylglutathione lyase family enzyme